MIDLRHVDVRHYVIIECSHLANGCTIDCGCIGLMLFRNLSYMGAMICHIITIGFVSVYVCRVCDVVVSSCANTHLVSMNQN